MSFTDASFMAAEATTGPWSWLRHQFSALRIVCGTMFRADPARTVALLVLRPANAAGAMIAALWLRYIVERTTRGTGSLAVGAIGLALTFALVLLCSWVAVIVESRLQERTAHQFDQRVGRAVWDEPSLALLDTAAYRDRLELLKDDSASLPTTVTAVIDMVSAIAAAAIGVSMLLSVSPVLLGLVVAAIPSLWAGKRAEAVRQRVLIETAEPTRAGSDVFDLATSPQAAKEVRTLGLQDQLRERYARVSADVVAARRRAWYLWAGWQSASWAIFVAAFAAGLVYVMSEADAGRATPGDVVLVVIVGAQMNVTVAALAYSVTFALGSIHAVDRLTWIERATQLRRHPSAPPVTNRGRPRRPGIQLRDVRFTYSDGTPAIDGVSLWLPPGTVTAVVGENGAGKTTLVKLLARLYEPDEGEIFLNGVPIRELDAGDWRASLAGVLQDFARFELRARWTVGVGDLARSDDADAVREAMARAGASELMAELPNGADTPLGSSYPAGHEPSGGQWQKLALGRAMMREAPRLLLLDEPTSALDPLAEERVLAAYAEICDQYVRAAGAMAVITSHRLSAVGIADQIVVIDAGRIAEVGTHAELVVAGGPYAELYETQTRAYFERPTLTEERPGSRVADAGRTRE